MKYWREVVEVLGGLLVVGTMAYVEPVLAVGFVVGVGMIGVANAGGSRADSN